VRGQTRHIGYVVLSPPRLMIVEDDDFLRDAVSSALQQVGYVVLARATGEDLGATLTDFHPDVAVLDIRLPAGPDGFELAREVKASSAAAVIFLTAADAIDDRLRGFEIGADDYLVKPFAMAELLARIRVVLRRLGRLHAPVIEVRDLIIDQSSKAVKWAGEEVLLTPTEFELLCTFAREPGRVFSKAQLLSMHWGFESSDPNLVEVYVSSLRKKLGRDGAKLIYTERNRGYSLLP
jgi:two-component system, OmpR family, response regulator